MRISSVDAKVKPPLFRLEDLFGVPDKYCYYKEELQRVEGPKPGETFEVDKIVKEKKVNGIKYYLVRYK